VAAVQRALDPNLISVYRIDSSFYYKGRSIMNKGSLLAVVSVAISATVGVVQATPPEVVELNLTPSSGALAACMPDAHVTVTVRLTTDVHGFDVFRVHATGLPPNTAFTTFLLEQAGAPFGAAEYIGDFTSDEDGEADNTFRLIVAEAFASTLVDGHRVRVDLNRVGAWFADPTGDDFCLGPNSPVTPFDGDNEAGVQAFNSANAPPLPRP
jgi:hypothetical protein